jgi:hypothetical protein
MEGRIALDEGAGNIYRIEYTDVDNSTQTEGLFDGQLEKGNVEVLIVPKELETMMLKNLRDLTVAG